MSDDGGITFTTDDTWSATVVESNQLILGEFAELIAGMSLSFTGGASISIFILDLLEVFLGLRQVISNDTKFNFSTEEKEVKALKEKVGKQLTEIATVAKIEAMEAKVKAARKKVDAADTAWKAHDGNYKLVADKASACAKKTDVAGAKEVVAAEVTNLLAAQEQTVGAKIRAVAQDTKAVAEKSEKLGTIQVTAAQSISNIIFATELHTETTAASGLFFAI